MSGVSRVVDRIGVTFDDETLVADVGLIVPATLVVRLGLETLFNQTVRLVGGVGGALPGLRFLTLVASILVGWQPHRSRRPASCGGDPGGPAVPGDSGDATATAKRSTMATPRGRRRATPALPTAAPPSTMAPLPRRYRTGHELRVDARRSVHSSADVIGTIAFASGVRHLRTGERRSVMSSSNRNIGVCGPPWLPTQ